MGLFGNNKEKRSYANGYLQVRGFLQDETCRKCGGRTVEDDRGKKRRATYTRVEYRGDKDLVEVKCWRCGYRWYEHPQDKAASTDSASSS